MKAFAQNQKTDDWILLEFSRLGFIGKLFKTTDVPSLSQFILMFYQTKPVDYLLEHYIFDRLCIIYEPQRCKRETQSARIQYKPSLFQHMGYQSSLPGKVTKQLLQNTNARHTYSRNHTEQGLVYRRLNNLFFVLFLSVVFISPQLYRVIMEYMYNISIIFVCDTDTAVERFRLLTEDRLFAMGSQRFKY